MKILLTGKPGSGKSTVIEKFIESFSGEATWVLTKEIRNQQNERVGFRGINSLGGEGTISHKADIESDYVIGSNKVDLPKIDELFTKIISNVSSEKIIVLDEIGPIQLLSKNFQRELDQVFENDASLLATIHLQDQKVEKYKKDLNTMLVEINLENRDKLPGVLTVIFENIEQFDRLNINQKNEVRRLLKDYFSKLDFVQIRKLFNNAIKYVNENQVEKVDDSNFIVRGNHGQYRVGINGGNFECECDLSGGLGKYQEAGECSHIQAVKIYNS